MLNRYFLEEHYQSLEIRSFIYASKALEELQSDAGIPDFILLDINMPGMNGWEFLEALEVAAIPNAVLPKIYILSSSLDPEDQAKAQSAVLVKGFISKPLDVDKLPFLTV